MELYVSVFPDSRIEAEVPYGKDASPNAEDSLMYASFRLAGQKFSAMDSALDHGFDFNEAVSLMVHCDSQEELDTYWRALSASPEAEQCGWLKDKFGLSWQIVPREIDAMMAHPNPETQSRVTKAMLGMKKLDIQALRDAEKEISPVGSYIARFSGEMRAKLEEIRLIIREAAPQAKEKISYQMPTLDLCGNLVHYAAQARHLGFYPSPSAIEEFEKELGGYKHSKGAVQFPLGKPLPADLIARMVRYRVAENLAAAESKARSVPGKKSRV
ncbi:MAG: 3-demethylubiquinone-9 3-methyltransferase [Spirochaetes bacterium]|nr:MAG: 3-demethylubiquinone-9 3-methyltransferase [Spirochaetota bacterium]